MRSSLAPLALLLVLAAPAVAAARGPSTAELKEDGLSDPRLRRLPARHRLRLSLLADYVRASQACTPDLSRCQRFHFAPLALDLAYQVQVFGRAMIRPSLAIGGNVANSRNAMPLIVQPGLFVGYQGALLGFAVGYSYIVPFPAVANNTDGRRGLAQPVLWNNHVVAAEVSLTTRVDRGALNFAVRFGGMKTHLIHLDLDKKRWFPVVTFSAGWFFDLTGKRRRAREAP